MAAWLMLCRTTCCRVGCLGLLLVIGCGNSPDSTKDAADAAVDGAGGQDATVDGAGGHDATLDSGGADAPADADAAPDDAPTGACPNEPVASSGALRTAFGQNGKLDINPSPRIDTLDFALALDGEDLYLTGGDQSGGENDHQIHIEKRNRCTGALVPSFGAGGVVTSNIGPYADSVGVTSIAGGSLYLVGAESAGATDGAWRIEKRSAADGALDPSFGSGGVVTHNPSGFMDVALYSAIDAQHLFVIGFDSAPGEKDQQWRLEKRRLSDGGLVNEFGTAGVITENPGPARDMVQGVAIDATSLYIVGNDSAPGNDQWRVEKRSLVDGSLVTAFGSGGVISFNPSPGPERVYAIAIQPPFMIITGVDGSPGFGDFALRIEKRTLADGALVTSFGADGSVTTNPSAGLDRFLSMAVDSDAIYLTGIDNIPGGTDFQWRVEKRSVADGALVTTFANGGVISENFSAGDEWAYRVLLDSNSLYLLGDILATAPDDYGWHLQRRAK